MRRVPVRNIVLFVLTCFFVLLAGTLMEGADPFTNPSDLVEGLPFAVTLMLILLSHEFSHYAASRLHGVDASLPYFIPIPPIPGMLTIGTLGAVIKMRSPIINRKALIDIGASGPVVGFVVSVAASAYGLANSSFVQVDNSAQTLELGGSIIFSTLSWLLVGPVPEGMDIYLHPVGFAGWLGCFITCLNLIPIGQLDGGHILFALFGERHLSLGKVLVVLLGIMGLLFWPGWMLWAVLMIIIGLRHPPVLYWESPLDPFRKKIGWTTLAVFIITFTPMPFTITGL